MINLIKNIYNQRDWSKLKAGVAVPLIFIWIRQNANYVLSKMLPETIYYWNLKKNDLNDINSIF